MASQIPALEAQALVGDPRWPAYREALIERLLTCEHRIIQDTKDYPQMCRLAGEIRGLRFALGIPTELSTSDPRSDSP